MTPEIRKAAEEHIKKFRVPSTHGFSYYEGAQFGYALAIQRLRSEEAIMYDDIEGIDPSEWADWLEQQEGK